MSEQEPGQNLNSFSEKPEPWSNESISWLPPSSSSCPLHPIPSNKKKRSSKKNIYIYDYIYFLKMAQSALLIIFFLVIIFYLLLQNTSAIIHSHFLAGYLRTKYLPPSIPPISLLLICYVFEAWILCLYHVICFKNPVPHYNPLLADHIII